jgi:hypoxanthine phosphoribosyltransferase
MQHKKYLKEQDVLLDAYRLGVEVFNSGFRPSFIVGLWRGGSTVGIAVQECLQALGVGNRSHFDTHFLPGYR